MADAYRLPAHAHLTVWANAIPGLAATDVSAVFDVVDGSAIVAERSMYLSRPGLPFSAGHESAGVPAAATEWTFAEGATGPYFDEFILLANPGVTAANVEATYLLADGSTFSKTYVVPANARLTIWVDEERFGGVKSLDNASVSAVFRTTNGVPIVAERAMWWPGPTSETWQEAHNSPGATETGTAWLVADGEVGADPGRTETFILVANRAASPASLKVTLLFPYGGAPPSERTVLVAANARFTIDVRAMCEPRARRRSPRAFVSAGGCPPVGPAYNGDREWLAEEVSMAVDRRAFLATAGALAVGARHAFATADAVQSGSVLPASVRADFPSVSLETYLNSAAMHPLGTFAGRAIEEGVAFRVRGPGEGRADFGPDKQAALKERYASLINAKASEIAFTGSTSDAENIVVMGMDLPKRGGNIVLDELAFTTSLYMYKELEKKGVELRVVKHRNWAIDVKDMERAIDKSTRLVTMALVSNVNGFMHDAKAVSAIAHAHGAYLFADIIQAVGAVPVDVRALGIDFASAGTYKWLMGERGLGFLYVREDLQDSVVPTTRYGHRQIANFNRAQLTWEPLPGAAKYETGGIPVLLAACVHEGIGYVQRLGVDKIRAHAKQLTDRLQRELPPLGYQPLTPAGTETPILAFQLKDAAATSRTLKAGKVAATVIDNESRLRLSVSVFNTHADIDRVVEVLGGKRGTGV